MAIIRNTTGDVISGTIGDMTYRNVNGRTIVSKRITGNSSNTPKQVAARKAFGEMSRLATALGELLHIGFNKEKYGTSRNQFIRFNKELSNYYKAQDYFIEESLSIFNLCMAQNDPMFMGKVITSEGDLNLQNSFETDKEGKLSGWIRISRKYQEGDQITLGLGLAFQINNDKHNLLYHQTKTLNTQDIQELIDPYTFRLDMETFPIPSLHQLIPQNSTIIAAIATGIIIGRKDKSMGHFSAVTSSEAD